jgi:hypothetical protein
VLLSAPKTQYRLGLDLLAHFTTAKILTFLLFLPVIFVWILSFVSLVLIVVLSIPLIHDWFG